MEHVGQVASEAEDASAINAPLQEGAPAINAATVPQPKASLLENWMSFGHRSMKECSICLALGKAM